MWWYLQWCECMSSSYMISRGGMPRVYRIRQALPMPITRATVNTSIRGTWRESLRLVRYGMGILAITPTPTTAYMAMGRIWAGKDSFQQQVKNLATRLEQKRKTRKTIRNSRAEPAVSQCSHQGVTKMSTAANRAVMAKRTTMVFRRGWESTVAKMTGRARREETPLMTARRQMLKWKLPRRREGPQRLSIRMKKQKLRRRKSPRTEGQRSTSRKENWEPCLSQLFWRYSSWIYLISSTVSP